MTSHDLLSPRGRVRRARGTEGRNPAARYISDLTLAERKDAVVALGIPGFRADQLSRQWFRAVE